MTFLTQPEPIPQPQALAAHHRPSEGWDGASGTPSFTGLDLLQPFRRAPAWPADTGTAVCQLRGPAQGVSFRTKRHKGGHGGQDAAPNPACAQVETSLPLCPSRQQPVILGDSSGEKQPGTGQAKGKAALKDRASRQSRAQAQAATAQSCRGGGGGKGKGGGWGRGGRGEGEWGEK